LTVKNDFLSVLAESLTHSLYAKTRLGIA